MTSALYSGRKAIYQTNNQIFKKKVLDEVTRVKGERGALVIEPLTPEREVGGLIPYPAMLCP